MNIIIPMAGMGKRMRPHTITTPKPLVPIAGKPMVHRIVEDIVKTTDQKVEEIAFIISRAFGKEAEDNLVAVAEKFGAKGKIFYQDTPMGTAHAIYCAKECLHGNILVAFADTLFDASFILDTEKEAIIWTQKVDEPSAFGVVQLNDQNLIVNFVEKPTEFVSDLAIIGVYYFKDGDYFKREIEYVMDHNIMHGGEYGITDVMKNMMSKGTPFYTGEVQEWLDCGNKDATLYTLERILELKKGKESLRSISAKIENSSIIEPCFIGENVIIKNAVVGPYVSLENNACVENSVVSSSIVGQHSSVKNSIIKNSLLGNHVNCQAKEEELSLGDYSFKK